MTAFPPRVSARACPNATARRAGTTAVRERTERCWAPADRAETSRSVTKARASSASLVRPFVHPIRLPPPATGLGQDRRTAPSWIALTKADATVGRAPARRAAARSSAGTMAAEDPVEPVTTANPAPTTAVNFPMAPAFTSPRSARMAKTLARTGAIATRAIAFSWKRTALMTRPAPSIRAIRTPKRLAVLMWLRATTIWLAPTTTAAVRANACLPPNAAIISRVVPMANAKAAVDQHMKSPVAPAA